MTEQKKPKRERKPRPFPQDGLVNITEILDFMNVGRTHFYGLIKRGKVQPPQRLGGAVRWPAKHIREVAGLQS